MSYLKIAIGLNTYIFCQNIREGLKIVEDTKLKSSLFIYRVEYYVIKLEFHIFKIYILKFLYSKI
jgi:hypothetical protein